MDVVYNHTCESGPEGPTICWRGLDNLAYYRRTKDKVSRLYDTTGCGNSLDFTNTHVTTFAVDSLALLGQANRHRRLPLRPCGDAGAS